jgi:hypothetical protein
MLNQGEFIDIVVGQVGADGSGSDGSVAADDGGGTFVYVDGVGQRLIVAGGGASNRQFSSGANHGDGSVTIVEEDSSACCRRGALILTHRGEVAVEDLAVGDRLVTLEGEARPIRFRAGSIGAPARVLATWSAPATGPRPETAHGLA